MKRRVEGQIRETCIGYVLGAPGKVTSQIKAGISGVLYIVSAKSGPYGPLTRRAISQTDARREIVIVSRHQRPAHQIVPTGYFHAGAEHERRSFVEVASAG